jgi:hypothetical protein
LQPGDSLTTPSASFVYVLRRRPATFVRIAPSLPRSGIWCMHGLSIHAPQALTPGLHATLNDWWEAMLVGVDKRVKRSQSGRLLYVIWNVWKERNRRIF